MHFVTGGAFNGKGNWVKEHYQLSNVTDFYWLSCYDNNPSDSQLTSLKKRLIVIEAIEFAIKEDLENGLSLQACTEKWFQLIDNLLYSKKSKSQKIVLIGSDISKGIVPLDKLDRDWRDATGLIYQEIVRKSAQVHNITYGIASKLK